MRVRSARFRVAVGVHRVIRSLSAVSTAVSDWTVYRKTGPVSRRGQSAPAGSGAKQGTGRRKDGGGPRRGGNAPAGDKTRRPPCGRMSGRRGGRQPLYEKRYTRCYFLRLLPCRRAVARARAALLRKYCCRLSCWRRRSSARSLARRARASSMSSGRSAVATRTTA